MNEKTPVKKSRRWLVGALALAAAAALLVAVYRPRPLPVEVATVRIGTFEQAIEEDGRLRVTTRYIVAAPTQAALLRPSLKVGDVVKAGDLLVTLEPAAPQMIDARTRSVLQQRVGSADAARHAAAAQVQRARTELARATLEADRASQLAQDNFISAAARDQATLARQATQQALSAAQAEQGVADHALAEARAALARAEPTAAGQASGRWHLTSPVDGQVLKLYQDSAVTVTAGQPLLEIGNTAAMEAVIDVLSGEVARIRPGAPVQLSPGGGAPAMAGQVTRVEPVAFTKVSALGIEEQRVNVVVDLPPSSAAQLGDGYRVDARITVLSQPNALLVPTAALVRDGAQWRVLVVTAGHARARPVLLHDRNAEVAWLKDGLREGEQVVLYPGSLVTDGQAVRVASQAKKVDVP
ncbi:HlyD family efflux transporter periplasmic adaptor subunit [Rhodoferax sp. U2-2l]|uniref:efflux RND transporter periplasmic adaptor subunit n=1 Tax=Rhodoferax sp. U2-2l TaxID=2884000 RepID=UPI001D0AD0AC|nr:HlyD family efflux transporter periplasmic adaptor subunit [Rhodoferax sp. U2-2l]MCB8748104.1 HlyD family efflux transporter periplasmic adaptor subunit [Rhodoferax sp. U2-2l]